MRYLQKSLFLALGACLFAACSSSNTTPHVAGTAKPLFINYTAIGASDAVGYGASVPCTEASPALVADPTCPEAGASGYVPDIRTDFAGVGFDATLQDLGISGAVIGPDILADVNQFDSVESATPCQPRSAADAYPADFLTNELPKVNPAATYVTIFAGGNDVNGIVNAATCLALAGETAAQQTTYVTAEITKFGHDFATLVGSVHAKAPGAIIVIANIPNFANVPYALALPAALRGALQEVSVAIDTNVINTVVADGIPVVDVQCNASSYDAANFYTDGFHPNDKGYAILASLFVSQALATVPVAPQTSCSYQAVSSIARQADAHTAILPGMKFPDPRF